MSAGNRLRRKQARIARYAAVDTRAPKGERALHDLGKRFMWRCHYCHRRVHCAICDQEAPIGLQATRDHYVPKSRGGRNAGANIVLACKDCNDHKADALPGDARGQRVRAQTGGKRC